MGDWRLEDCTLYVTLEPCQMCAGAIVQARITEVVMGSMNPKAGCGGSILNILEMPEFNHQVQVRRGILAEECTQMLTDFFKELRIRNRQEKELRRLQQADHDPAAAAAFLKEENIVNHRQMGYNVHDSNEQ